MLEIEKIEDLYAQLEGLGKNQLATVATRSALRALHGLGVERSPLLNLSVLAVLRGLITSTSRLGGRQLGTLQYIHAVYASTTAAESAASHPASRAAVRATTCTLASFGASSKVYSLASVADATAQSIFAAKHSESREALTVAAISTASKAIELDIRSMEDEAAFQNIFDNRLWCELELPRGTRRREEALTNFWKTEPLVWGYWLRWYNGFLEGNPLDWDVQRAIASLPSADWEKGPHWIAEKIEEIEAGDPHAVLAADELSRQSRQLLDCPILLETNARGLLQLGQMAIDAYRREISNALPDCFEPVEAIPTIAHEIAFIVARDIQVSEKEVLLAEQIQLMASTIAELNARLKRVPSLKDEPSGRKVFADAFYKKSGERVAELWTSKLLWGGIATGVGFVLGPSGDALVDTLSQCYSSVIAPEVPADGNPSITWHTPPKI